MNIKVFRLSILLLTASVLLFGCKSENPPAGQGSTAAAELKKEIKVALNAQPPSLDPHMVTSSVTRDVMKNVFETLVTLDGNYNTVPYLAEKIDIGKDNTEYTFHLRQGIKFHNGKEMTSDDVAASMNRWKEKSSRAKGIIGDAAFAAADKYTVVLQLKSPSFDLLPLMSNRGQFAAIYPKEVVEAADPKTGIKDYIGTGPFQFKEWKADQYVRLTRFADYQPRAEQPSGLAGKREALVDDAYFYFVTDHATRLAGLQTGTYDVSAILPQDTYQQILAAPAIKADPEWTGDLSVTFNKKAGIMSNVKMREAVAAALDNEKALLAAVADKSFYRLNSSYFYEGTAWYSAAGKDKYNRHDAQKAKRLLTEAGYKGEEIRLITTRDYEHWYNPAVVIKDQLEQVGMKIKLEVYDLPTLTTKRSDPANWDLHMGSLGDVTTPSQLIYLSPASYGWPEDPKLAELVKASGQVSAPADIRKIADELQAYGWDYLPIAKLGEYAQLNASGKKVQGLTYFAGPVIWNTKVLK